MTIRLFALSAIVTVYLSNIVCADLISFIPMPPTEPTGANANALAGPLFDSDIDSKDIPGPTVDSAFASKLGNFATHDYAVELDFSGGPAFFDSSYAGPFSRTATIDHRASAESFYAFVTDVPTFYDISGFFSVTDDVGTTIPGNVELELELLEFDSFSPGSPPPISKFYSYQVSHSTIDQTFEAGMMDGDFANVLTGSPTGMLDPSKFYTFRTLVTINAIDPDAGGPLLPTDGGASATGAHVIVFHGPSVIPEPTSLSLLALGGLMLIGRTRTRKGNRKAV